MPTLQEYVKDKKNTPVVAGVGAAVLVLAIVLFLLEAQLGPFAPKVPTAPVVATNANGGYPGDGVTPSYPGSAPGGAPAGGLPPPGGPPPGGPGGPGAAQTAAAPGAPGAKPGAAPAAPPVKVAGVPDPFLVSGYGQSTVHKAPVTPVREVVPDVFIATGYAPPTVGTGGVTKSGAVQLEPEISSTERVSGVVLASGSGPQAILQSSTGQQVQVHPGQAVDNGVVESIQTDGLILKMDDGRRVRVPVGSFPSPPQNGGYQGGGYNGGGGGVDTGPQYPGP